MSCRLFPLGRLLPDYFPKIFGPSEKEPLDSEATTKAFLELTKEVNEYYATHSDGQKKVITPDEVAHGFIDVANGISHLVYGDSFNTVSHLLTPSQRQCAGPLER